MEFVMAKVEDEHALHRAFRIETKRRIKLDLHAIPDHKFRGIFRSGFQPCGRNLLFVAFGNMVGVIKLTQDGSAICGEKNGNENESGSSGGPGQRNSFEWAWGGIGVGGAKEEAMVSDKMFRFSCLFYSFLEGNEGIEQGIGEYGLPAVNWCDEKERADSYYRTMRVVWNPKTGERGRRYSFQGEVEIWAYDGSDIHIWRLRDDQPKLFGKLPVKSEGFVTCFFQVREDEVWAGMSGAGQVVGWQISTRKPLKMGRVSQRFQGSVAEVTSISRCALGGGKRKETVVFLSGYDGSLEQIIFQKNKKEQEKEKEKEK